MRRNTAALAVFAAGVLSLGGLSNARGQQVSLGGVMGSKALLLVNGEPITLAVGDSARGVKLLHLHGDTALVETGAPALRTHLRLGGQPASVGAAAPRDSAAARQLVLHAGPGGHFIVSGRVNGRSLPFMVDTGATQVALSRQQAERLGLDWRQGQAVMVGTANGPVQAHQINLSGLRIGTVEVANVAALVVPAALPHALLGNSFLSRFQMRRDNDVMRLDLRP